MAVDERVMFLDIFHALDAKAIETALKQTAMKLPKQRKANAAAARQRLTELDGECQALRDEFGVWREANPGAAIPENMAHVRDRAWKLTRERENLKGIISIGDLHITE